MGELDRYKYALSVIKGQFEAASREFGFDDEAASTLEHIQDILDGEFDEVL